MGYSRAGFDVTGVDIKPMPRYPFPFIQADALEYLEQHGHEYDVIHASPPCQAYSSATPREHSHPDLYAPTRDLLVASGLPYIIENVIGAPYTHGIYLCGSMFGLTVDGEWIQRHRNFETSWFMFQPSCAHPTGQRAVTVTTKSFVSQTRTIGKHSRQGTFALSQQLMGIDWTSRNELGLAIPPAYTEFIGSLLLSQMKEAA